VPIDTSVTAAFEAIPLPLLRDPWDRLITATARALGVPLVTKDGRITAAGLVEVIW
jgi:PIN domain nuclease of toxin-antitoxin system